MAETKPIQPLWTRDFTIITIGSAVSLLGGVLSSFAISIMVLDYTGSTFLYALFNVAYQLPMLIVPLLAGPYLDRMSRKRAVYCLDYMSSGLYLVFFFLLWRGWFNYPVMLFGCLLNGVIGSVYLVAYESFYPNLITEGNYSKAYSVSSVMMDLTGLAYPLGAILYEKIGTPPLFLIAAAGYFIAACFERTIQYQETHMDKASSADGVGTLQRFRTDFREGLDYIRSEKGLLVITVYFMVSGFVGSGSDSLYLPFFRNHGELYTFWPVAAVTLYTIISNFFTIGRFAGGVLHYKVKIPPEMKFAIALTVYVLVDLFEGMMLWLPIPLMALALFLNGSLSVTSYNIRIAATQSYVPDTRRARFNGVFQMMTSVGGIVGSLTAGGLAEFLPERIVILILSALGLLSVYLFMYRGRRHVSAIYNRDL